jgi:hypothetical protein
VVKSFTADSGHGKADPDTDESEVPIWPIPCFSARIRRWRRRSPRLSQSLDDRAEIEMSEQFFARKVKTGISTSLLEWLDRERLRLT